MYCGSNPHQLQERHLGRAVRTRHRHGVPVLRALSPDDGRGELVVRIEERAVAQGPATLGTRPEHVVTGELVGNAPFQIDVTIGLIEPTGSDTLVDCEVAGVHFRVRMDGQAKVSVGDTLRIGLDPSKASLFDKETELRL